MIPMTEWKWFGYPGHFICAEDCRFRLCTQVGEYLVSTVGDLHYSHEPAKRRTLGCDENSFFETYVFKAGPVCSLAGCGCGQPSPADSCEIDGLRTPTAGDAQRAHLDFCLKYASNAHNQR